MVFNNDFICEACPTDILNSFQHGIYNIDFPTLLIKVLRGHSYNQVVSQRLRTLQQIVMPLMKQIKGAVSYDLFHRYPRFPAFLCIYFNPAVFSRSKTDKFQIPFLRRD